MRCRPNLPHFFGILLLLLSACDRQKPDVGFYFWRSGEPISEEEMKYLLDSEAGTCYLRLTDIVVNPSTGSINPVGYITDIPVFPEEIELIPVVYIQNQVFLEGYQPDYLADMLWTGVEPVLTKYGCRELQIDCDWTKSSRTDYFSFLENIQTCLGEGRVLSVTIRLHQSKYPEITGVPPADKGMLMFYNMSVLTDPKTSNYIFDPEIADDYLINFNQYPLPLDVALPIYSQGVWIRNNRVIGLMPGLNEEDMHYSELLDPEKDNMYVCVKEGFFRSEYLNVGDRIRLEAIKPNNLQNAAEMLAPYFGKSPSRVVFYHLDEIYLKQFSHADIHRAVKPFY
jgi:hypothetical protein